MTPRMTEENSRLAVLIDADNTSPKRTREKFEELASYGTLTVQRAYGDWTDQRLSGWKGELHRHAISPMQQFANTSGKNATDSALIIDAMDLLYAGNVGGFVIVSSDADFTKLATRLRESGMTVYGLGQRKTPKPFVEACDKFIYLEVLGSNGSETDADEESTDGDSGSREPDGALHSLITRSVNKSPQDDEDWTQLSTLANLLNRSDPRADRSCGCGSRAISPRGRQPPPRRSRLGRQPRSPAPRSRRPSRADRIDRRGWSGRDRLAPLEHRIGIGREDTQHQQYRIQHRGSPWTWCNW